MTKINNNLKEQLFRFPNRDFFGFGRKLSCAVNGNGIWTAVQMETADKNTILITRKRGNDISRLELPTAALCHQPRLVSDNNDRLALVWNEFKTGIWQIKYAPVINQLLALGTVETIFSSTSLCLPPVADYFSDMLWIAFPTVSDGNLRITVVKQTTIGWDLIGQVSEAGIDAFRPTICSNQQGIHLFWDQYKNGKYEIAGCILNETGSSAITPAATDNERWFCPDAVSNNRGQIFLAWVVMQETADKLGIVDHSSFSMVGQLKHGKLEILKNYNNRVVADLREGLLASDIYKGYLGLRRNPRLSTDSNGHLWCFWEVRLEAEATALSGHLAGRCFDGENWSEPALIANLGYGYATAICFDGKTLPVACFKFEAKGMDIVNIETIDIDRQQSYVINEGKWARWGEFNIPKLIKNRRAVKVNNSQYSMFWADTHCHSNFSADAEGEPDEIIHYARDIAGLDALCVIDNDFYPNKSLSPAEWQIHQEFSRHFTRTGEFVLFPGYEFTYHRHDLSPDFNHRCVIYPGPAGQMFRRIDQGSETDKEMLAQLKQTNGMCYPHHCTYELLAADKEWNVEICSSWRAVLAECDFSIQQLKAGHKFGFIGSSDAHRANPGLGGALTGLFATELTPEALFDAYQNRRIIATQGFAVFIDFRVAGLFIGSQGNITKSPLITAAIEAPDSIEAIEIFRDGEIIHRATPGNSTYQLSFTDNAATAGNHFYFLRLKLVGAAGLNGDPSLNSRRPFEMDSDYPHNLAKARGVFAWTSPIWLCLVAD
ncbi:MAG: hypothetical protein L3J71_05735 [Victivallaceae bacterium]|nr:hypothetical protein [Victivallaceae bacterium]